MDRSRPFRRLLPAVGLLSAAGLAGCASAPAYRPVVTSAAPSRPLATADSSNSSLTPATPAPGPPSVPPPATPVAPPLDAAPVSLMPAPPAQSVSEPSTSGGPTLNAPGTNGIQPYLSAPMGVLQTPLPAPEAPTTAPVENAPPLPAGQRPTDGPSSTPAAPAVSVNIDAAAGAAPTAATQKPQPGKKSTKPAEPPLSPLARLRKRFHSITHPPKKDPEQKSVLADPQGPATQIARPVSGYRVPLPTGEVAVKVSTPPVHGLYASEDVDNTRPIVSDVNTAHVEPSPQQAQEISQAPITSAAAATKPAADTEIEQWPYSAPATTTAHPNPEAADSTKDFTAISAEDYRAGVAKIAHANGPTTTELAIQPTTAPPPAAPQQAQPDDSAPPEASFAVGSAAIATAASPVVVPLVIVPPVAAIPVAVPAVAAPGPAEADKPAMIVIPQAAPKAPMVVVPQASPRPQTEPPAEPARSSGMVAAPQSAGAGESIRDLASGAPTSAALWSPPSQRPALEPISGSSEVSITNTNPSSNSSVSNSIDTNAKAGSTFNEATLNAGWTLPPAIVRETRSTPSPAVVAPQYPLNPQPTSGRYAQPVWMRARVNSNGSVNSNGNAVQPAAQPAPQTVTGR